MRVRVGVHHGAQRGEEHLPGLGVEVAVHPDHAAEGGGHVEAAPPEALVLTRLRLRQVQACCQYAMRVRKGGDGERPSRLHERLLGADEGLRMGLTGGREEADGGFRELACR